jgi:hypothetical protein
VHQRVGLPRSRAGDDQQRSLQDLGRPLLCGVEG